MEYKDLPFIAGAMEAGQPNEELKAWAGVDSAPVVAANSYPPINRWNDILLLLEELSPKSLGLCLSVWRSESCVSIRYSVHSPDSTGEFA